MMNQLKMMKLVRLRIEFGSRRTKVSLGLARNFGQPLTINILWSALSNYDELNDELNAVGLVLHSVIFASGVSREPYKSLFPYVLVCSSSVTNFEACDWSTRISLVILLWL
jgi:hypothetical protein